MSFDTNKEIKSIKSKSDERIVKGELNKELYQKERKREYLPFDGTKEFYLPKHIENTLVIIKNDNPIEFKVIKNEYDSNVIPIQCKTDDKLVMSYNYESKDSEWSIEFEKYLKSIEGLANGYYTDRPPILSRYFFSIGDGWLPLVKDLIEELIADGWNKQICQVKEKLGGLRFYTNGGGDNHNNIITKYEKLADKTCEECSKEGKARSGGWIKTLCDEHGSDDIDKNQGHATL